MTHFLKLGALSKKSGVYTKPIEASKQDEYICIDCKNDVIIRKGNIRTHHFAHCNKDSKCNFYNTCNESELHKNAKQILKYVLENKIPLIIDSKCCKCDKITTHKIPKITDDSVIVDEYRFDYNGIKIADIAYVKNDKLLYIFEIYKTHKTETCDRPEPWFELEANDILETFNNSLLQKMHLTCTRDITCDTCNENKNGIIYFNQRGAGCGKTYESIQLLQNNKKFKDKEIFFYLTKMHTAKDVIYNELKEQEEKGLLNTLEMTENDIKSNKQYKVTYTNKQTNKEIMIIIGTVDSFNYAIVDKSKIIKHNDYFTGIVKTIQKGNILHKDIKMSYAGEKISINKKCLVIIDEAQDLGDSYIEAFNTIILQMQIDVYVIGDKLQSITDEQNIYTYIDTNNLDTHIERSNGINKVMRFHNEQFINFVNSVIPFEKYNLPSITEICDGTCKYEHTNDDTPYNIFEVPKLYASEFNYFVIDNIIEKIIFFMEKEINEHKYLPKNFMFIFPILSKNVFATMLETRIQNFWINKFNDKEYQKILKKDNFWKNKINDNKFYKYIFLHKHDEGKSINLKESENASRILTIHSSKGNGCEVVFLLGVSESTLTIFSKKKCNLVYDSLLHVALTRQKKSIYIGIEKNNDDICQRFMKLGIDKDENIQPQIECIRIHNKFSKVLNYLYTDNDMFDKINEQIIEPNDLKNQIKNDKDKKSIIDWGHHVIRHSVLIYNLMLNIIENEVIENNEQKDQFIATLRNLCNKEIVHYQYQSYNYHLRIIDKNNQKYQNNTEIPVLSFDANENSKYFKYTKILKDMMVNIQNKIFKYLSKNKLPPLCPLECIILLFMIKVLRNGSYADTSIMDIYSIMYCYDICSDEIDNEHTKKSKCICHKSFDETNYNNNSYNEIRQSIKNHYNNIDHVNTIYHNYKTYITDTLCIKNIKYNIFHNVFFGKKNKNFTMANEYTIIGYSEKSVIYFMIKPQLNDLNFNRVICEAILNNYLLLNCTPDYENNYTKYNNKKIYTCIVTLDSDEPIFYELNIDPRDILLKQTIKNYLLVSYLDYHELVYDFYNYCCKTKPKNKSSINYTIEQLDKYNKLPCYISNYFYDISKKIDSCNKNRKMIENVLSSVNNKELFISTLNTYLEKNIDIYLEMNIDEDIDY